MNDDKIKWTARLPNGATFTMCRPHTPPDTPEQHLTGHGRKLTRVQGHCLALPPGQLERPNGSTRTGDPRGLRAPDRG